MKIEIEINTDNSAFDDSPEIEIASIVTAVATLFKQGKFVGLSSSGYEETLNDFNGNKVARLIVTP